jgi:hypothetical protein
MFVSVDQDIQKTSAKCNLCVYFNIGTRDGRKKRQESHANWFRGSRADNEQIEANVLYIHMLD